MKEYRVGIVGFGFIGKVHAYGYLNLPLYYDPVPLRARVTHVVTSRPETAAKACATLGADVGTTDYRQVTENPLVDIVHICSPNDRHREAILSAMAHGKPIYCDKPLVASMAEAAEVAAMLPRYSATAQMTFHNRFFPATLLAKQLLVERRLGEIHEFRASYLHGGSASPDTPAKWKLTKAAGGGVIADLASHVLDLVDYLIGPIQSVSAATKIAYGERPTAEDPHRRTVVDAEDAVMMLARTAQGALGTIDATKLAAGTEDELRLEVYGSAGSLRFNLTEPHYLEFHDATLADKPYGGQRGWNRISCGGRYEPPAAAFPSPKASIGWLRGHVASLANFLQALAEGRPAEPGIEQGIRVQHLMDCAARSALHAQWIATGIEDRS